MNLSIDMKRDGIEPAYWKWLDNRPKLRELLVKLQDIMTIKNKLPKNKLLGLLGAIVADHEFEYREQLEKEGIKLRRGKQSSIVYPED